MYTFRKSAFAASLLALTACQSSVEKTEVNAASLVLTNGKIYTMNSEQKWAEAVAIKNGEIISVGNSEDVVKYIQKSTKVVNLHNKMVLPSFQDVHVHPMHGGLAYTGCVLFDLPNLDEVLAKVEQCVQENPNAEFIRGSGWHWGLFKKNTQPNKMLLDKINSKIPMAFGDSDGHTLWLNSAALSLAEITRDTPNPEGGGDWP